MGWQSGVMTVKDREQRKNKLLRTAYNPRQSHSLKNYVHIPAYNYECFCL